MTNPITPELAKELAEALRRQPCRCGTKSDCTVRPAVTRKITCRRCAALAKYDAERVARSGSTHSEECWRWHHGCAIAKIERDAKQAKTEEVSEPDGHRIAMKLTSLLGHVDMAIQSVSVVRERIEMEIPSIASVPAPSAVRAPAVVAAQGVTEEDVERACQAGFIAVEDWRELRSPPSEEGKT